MTNQINQIVNYTYVSMISLYAVTTCITIWKNRRLPDILYKTFEQLTKPVCLAIVGHNTIHGIKHYTDNKHPHNKPPISIH